MKKFLTNLLMTCIMIAALYYGFIQDVFIGRLYVYGLMTLMAAWGVGMTIVAILMRKSDIAFDPLKSIEYCQRVSSVPKWKQVMFFFTTGIVIGFFCASHHYYLAGVYGASVFAGRVATFSIIAYIEDLITGNLR